MHNQKKITSRYHMVLLGLCLFAWACNGNADGSGQSLSQVSRPPTDTRNKSYISNRAPLIPVSFVKLPIGSIHPEGWLLKCLELQRSGMTGNLEKISPWLEKKDNAWLSPEGKGVNGWEEVPYWLKGYGDLAYLLKDTAMISETKVWINGVLNSQRTDGYFGAERNRASGKPDLWPNMVMLWCLQSYYDFSGDKRVIPFMEKYFKWELQIPDSSFLEDYWGNSRGGDNLYSVYWLYNRTGQAWLLDLAKKIHQNTADWEQSGALPNWHNVNIAQGFREPAMYYMQSKDSADMLAAYRNFHLVRQLYGQVPGGMFGADENARKGYSDPHQGIETCGMVEQMNSDEMLLRFTGDPSWADNCEDVAFNTYPAALMPDFKSLRYFTAPNMVTSDSTNHSPGIENRGPFFMMNPLSNRCCQHNHTQGWPYYAENLWMATPDNGLAAVLYSEGTVTAKVGTGHQVTVEEKTHYPFSDTIELTVHTPGEVHFPLYLRVPDWCKDASVSINGEKKGITAQPDSYMRLENTWKDGDRILVCLPRNITVTRWTANDNSASVNYGPLTFSLKIKERFQRMDPTKTGVHDARWTADVDTAAWPAIAIYAADSWNYGLVLKDRDTAENFKIIHKPWPADDFPFTPQSSPIELTTTGKQIPFWTIDSSGLCGVLPPSPVAVATPQVPITLIPMGATRLRISAFPVVKP